MAVVSQTGATGCFVTFTRPPLCQEGTAIPGAPLGLHARPNTP